MSLAQGELLNGRYRIIEVLGHGGMGSVYRAHDESLSVDVAVKENLFTTEDYARQFRLEAVILAGLRHPNLTRVTDHFVLPGMGQYLVMDYIEGQDLRQILEKGGAIAEEFAARIGVAICDALTYLHTRKPPIIHRDIKLGNIKIAPDGQIYLVDFGLAKFVEGDQQTQTGARAMTPGYSPPEQYGSGRTDARSDVYSLGATLYAAITGFIAEDAFARAVDGLELTPLRKRNPKITPAFAATIEKAMEVQAASRFQSAEDFKQALLGYLPGQAAASQPSASQPQPSEPAQTPAAIADFPATDAEMLSVAPPRPRARVWVWLLFVVMLIGLSLAYLNPGIVPEPARAFLPGLASTSTATLTSSPTTSPSPQASATNPAPLVSPTPKPSATTRPSATPTPRSAVTAQPVSTISIATPTSAPFAAPAIVFVSNREGVPQIYGMDAEGAGQERLFLVPDGACQPAWSPDGRQLAYISPCGTRSDQYPKASVYIYDLVSGEITSLSTDPAGDFDPAWSPDGKTIVFTSLRDGHAQLYAFDLAARRADTQSGNEKFVRRLTVTEANNPTRQAAWARDSSTIYYSMSRFGFWQVWKINPDGSSPQQLIRSGAGQNDFLPVVAPDGSSIFFNQATREASAPARLMQYFFETDKAERLPIEPPVLDIDVSPTGAALLYEGNGGFSLDIFIFDLATGAIRQLTDDPGFDFDPVWLP
jgi:serine/threonine protein kinase